MIVSSEGNPFFDDVILGFRQAEKELMDYGVTLMMKTMRGYDVRRQLKLIGELEKAGVSALVIQPINDARIAEKLDELGSNGIPHHHREYGYRKLQAAAVTSVRITTAGGVTAAGVMRIVTGGKASLGIVTGVSMLLGHDQRARRI